VLAALDAFDERARPAWYRRPLLGHRHCSVWRSVFGGTHARAEAAANSLDPSKPATCHPRADSCGDGVLRLHRPLTAGKCFAARAHRHQLAPVEAHGAPPRKPGAQRPVAFAPPLSNDSHSSNGEQRPNRAQQPMAAGKIPFGTSKSLETGCPATEKRN